MTAVDPQASCTGLSPSKMLQRCRDTRAEAAV